MTILALDISSSCTGWAFLSMTTGIPVWSFGTIVRPKYLVNLTHNDLLMTDALAWFNSEIAHLIELHAPDYICAEDINIKFAMTMRTIAMFHAAASIAASDHDIKVFNKVSNASIRSVFGFYKYNVNKKMPKEKQEAIKALRAPIQKKAKENKVDFTKVLMVDNVNEMFGKGLQYSQHDIADAMAVAWTFCAKECVND